MVRLNSLPGTPYPLGRRTVAGRRDETAASSAPKRRRQRLSPMRKVIQRFRMRRIEVQRRNRNRPGENRRVIRVRLHVTIDLLLGQPEITPPARIFAFAQLI